MQVKFLKLIVENLLNKQASPIVDLLVGKEHVNEFLIAKKLDLTINQTRNILYRLSDYGLVSFIRKKDKRKGWYIYFWTLDAHQSLKLLEETLKKDLSNLENQLKSRNEKRFYVCNTCSIEISEETALLNDFACPECEEIYELSESVDVVKQLEKVVNKIKKELDLVKVEREKEEEKVEKKKTKIKKAAERKAEKIKKAKRAANKLARDKKKAAENKGSKKKDKKVKKSAKSRVSKLFKKLKPKKKAKK